MVEKYNLDENEAIKCCRRLASRNKYEKVFDVLSKHPKVMKDLTVDELNTWYQEGFSKTIPTRKIRGLKMKINELIFGEDKI